MIDRWLAKGVDGFRMDVINLISMTAWLTAARRWREPSACGASSIIFTARACTISGRNAAGELCRYDAVTVGETGLGMEMSKMLTAESRAELDMVFNFDALENPGKTRFDDYRYDLRYLKKYLLDWRRITVTTAG